MTARYQLGSHMMRVSDDAMAPRYRTGHWLGLVRCRLPVKGRDVIFVDRAGNMILGELRAITAASWHIGQFLGESRYTVRRLSRGRWRPAWRVVEAYLTAEPAAFYEAVALGLYERARQIQLAIGGKGSMPPPLTEAQRESVPQIVRVAQG